MKTKLILFLLLSATLEAQVMCDKSQLCPVSGGGGTPAYSQANTCPGSNGTSTTFSANCAYSSNVTSGNEIAVYAYTGSAVPTSWTTPTKQSGTATVGTFTLQGTCPTTASTLHECLWTAPITGTGSLTIHVSISYSVSTSSDIGGMVAEVNNVTQTVDTVSAYGSSNSCTSCVGSTLTTGGANRIVLTFVANDVTTISSSSPFTAHTFAADANGIFLAVGSFQQASAGLYSPTWTITGSGAQANVSVAIF